MTAQIIPLFPRLTLLLPKHPMRVKKTRQIGDCVGFQNDSEPRFYLRLPGETAVTAFEPHEVERL